MYQMTLDEVEQPKTIIWVDGIVLDPVLSGWYVQWSAKAERDGLPPYAALRDHYEGQSANDIPALALAVWYASTGEADQPDVTPSLFDALFLSGWRWEGNEFRRGDRSLSAKLPESLLWEATTQ